MGLKTTFRRLRCFPEAVSSRPKRDSTSSLKLQGVRYNCDYYPRRTLARQIPHPDQIWAQNASWDTVGGAVCDPDHWSSGGILQRLHAPSSVRQPSLHRNYYQAAATWELICRARTASVRERKRDEPENRTRPDLHPNRGIRTT